MAVDVMTIAHRLDSANRGDLSDEGLRRFYREDVEALIRENIALTKEREQVVASLKRLPIDPSDEVLVLAAAAVSLLAARPAVQHKAEVRDLEQRLAEQTKLLEEAVTLTNNTIQARELLRQAAALLS